MFSEIPIIHLFYQTSYELEPMFVLLFFFHISFQDSIQFLVLYRQIIVSIFSYNESKIIHGLLMGFLYPWVSVLRSEC